MRASGDMSDGIEATGARTPGAAAPAPEYRVIAGMAGRRGDGWRALADALAPPTPAFVEDLRSGAFVEAVARAIDWPGAERQRFLPHLASLWAFSREACARPPEEVRSELAKEHRRLLGRRTRRPAEIAAYLAVRCAEEQAAWQENDPARAKMIRVEQRRLLDVRLDDLRDGCAGLRPACVEPYRALAEILLRFVEVEAGGPG